MPELPEVEVVRQGLAPLVEGRRVKGVRSSGLALRAPIPLAALKKWVAGAVITQVGRRAKFLLLSLDNGALLLIHLGMTGKLYPADPAVAPRKHDHLRLLFDDGREIRFNDARRFGLVAVAPPAEAQAPALLAELGPEPLEESAFTAAYLYQRTRGRRPPIKNMLMDNRLVVGIGNIYACEILFAAGVNPFTPAGDLSRARIGRIVAATGPILRRSIAAGGATIADFANTNGEAGYFQQQLAVYGRAGQPCRRCQTPISRRLSAGRATFFCPRCQK